MENNVKRGPGAGAIVSIIVAVVAVGLIAYFIVRRPAQEQEPSDGGASQSSQESSLIGGIEKVIKLRLNEQNRSGESGTAILTEMPGGRVRVVVDLNGVPQDVAQPSHIHLGSCVKLGEIKFSLNDVLNGKAETVINTTFNEIFNLLPLALNVHKSAREADKYVACGDFTIQNLIEGQEYIIEAKG